MGRKVSGNLSLPIILRITSEVKSRAMALAQADDRSLNSWISLLVKKAVEQEANNVK
jgi:predicted HicB family RNase H-like nuclease